MTRILIIYTGGTIGMVHDQKTGVLVPFDFTQISQNVPELKRLNYLIDVHSFSPVIDSSDMSPEIWIELAKIIEKNYGEYDGFVILHGSDTMAFTASALSFMLQGLAKPVILTGSQLPIGEIRTDAKENLITALEIAASKADNGHARVPEVAIYFDYQLFRGNRAIKYDSEKFEAFQSPNYPMLAEAGVNLEFYENYILPIKEESFSIRTSFNSNIGVLKMYPGISKSAVEALTLSNVDALIIETFGAGNTPTAPWFLACLKEAVDSGKIVIDISQCNSGTVALGKYETSRALKDLGVLSGFDMTFEATVTKLMFLLGNGYSKQEVAKLMETNIKGELSKT